MIDKRKKRISFLLYYLSYLCSLAACAGLWVAALASGRVPFDVLIVEYGVRVIGICQYGSLKCVPLKSEKIDIRSISELAEGKIRL
jgi:hypothetical protein